ncbi:MAG TPA: iron ABC transporter permease [Acidobacteriota bacterium]|nr:iron ABC transporter permease [Acidobacteriota bacterium]
MKKHPVLVNSALIAVPLAAMAISIFFGKYQATPRDILSILISRLWPEVGRSPSPMLEVALLHVRLPRVLLAMLVGMSLSISGASYQGLFRNPLVSSHILGVASGASFGAAIAILYSAPPIVVQLSAFCFGLLAVGIALAISSLYRTSSTLTLVLVGMITTAFFSSLVSYLTYTADANLKLPAIVFWLMGSLSAASLKNLEFAIVPMAVGITALLAIRWRINVLSMGEDEAKALGINTGRLRFMIVLCCTLITSASVCVSGVIGWIGLIIPHFARMIVGPDHKALLPACLSIGGVYLLLVDNLARTLTNAEIPLGILTGIIGAPVFAYLLTRGERWS